MLVPNKRPSYCRLPPMPNFTSEPTFRSVRRFIFLIAAQLCSLGCSTTTVSECGGGQYAEAHAVLPDTGINAGDTISVGFHQYDTDERSHLAVQHLWPFATDTIDPEPDPRVRIVRGDGRVLLYLVGSRYYQPEKRHSLPTWNAFRWIRDASLRNALYEGFRNETLWIELWHARPPRLGTRVRLTTDRVGITEKAWCV
jgi:hypothetical protein